MENETKNQPIIQLASFLLILLWIYAALSKLIDLETFSKQLNNQVFPRTLTPVLSTGIPAIEIAAAGLLLTDRYRKTGLWLSFILMGAFTIYIAVVLGGLFDRVPCSCGGVLSKMGWKTHLYFNLFFLSLSLIGLYADRGTPLKEKHQKITQPENH